MIKKTIFYLKLNEATQKKKSNTFQRWAVHIFVFNSKIKYLKEPYPKVIYQPKPSYSKARYSRTRSRLLWCPHLLTIWVLICSALVLRPRFIRYSTKSHQAIYGSTNKTTNAENGINFNLALLYIRYNILLYCYKNRPRRSAWLPFTNKIKDAPAAFLPWAVLRI